jgi:virginiamycin A acetyltransferase
MPSATPKNLSARLRQASLALAVARQRDFERRLRRRGNVIEPGCLIPRGSQIGTRVRIGRETRFGAPIVIRGGPPASIGRWTLGGRGIRIITSNHRLVTPALQGRLQTRPWGEDELPPPVSIGSGVWIGDAAIVLPGVTVGDGAVIGAGSVVTRDVDPFAIVVGSPARELRKRFDDAVIEELLALAWWDWTDEKIAAEQAFFDADLTRCRVADVYRGEVGAAR